MIMTHQCMRMTLKLMRILTSLQFMIIVFLILVVASLNTVVLYKAHIMLPHQ